VRAEGRLRRKGEGGFPGHQAFQQLREENPNSRASLSSNPDTEICLQGTQLQLQYDQTSIILQLQQLDWILHARAIQCEKETYTQGMNKTDHDTTIIKPPLQQYNDPRLDHPCPSVLNNLYRQKWKERS
jgi:hypothetical protein